MNTSFCPALESLEPRLAPAGVITLSTAGGVLTATGDIADNQMEISSSGPGTWEIQDHTGGGTLFSLNGAPAAAQVTLFATQSIKATLNGGNDVIKFENIQVNGSVTVLGNDGDDSVLFNNILVNGLTTVDTGNGIDTITSGGVFNNLVTFKTGKGFDTVSLGDSFLGRGLTADLGTETNSFSIMAANFQSYGSISVVAAGSAVDDQTFSVETTNGFVSGGLSFKTSAGNTNLTLGGQNAADSLSVTGNVTVQTAAGVDTFTLQQDLLVGGALSIAAGDGMNTVESADLADYRFGSFSYTGGKGADTVELRGGHGVIGGAVNYNGGAGTSRLTISTTTSLRIGGALNYTGGVDNDTLTISGAASVVSGALTFKGGDGDNTMDMAMISGSLGSVSYTGGKGSDALFVGDATNLTSVITVHGNVASNMGAGFGRLEIRDLLAYGGISHTTANATGFEFVNIYDSTVLGTSTLKMDGNSEATITVNDSTFQSALSISTGGGADRVNFDTDDQETAITSIFNTTVKINLGAGDDFFNAGVSPTVATVGNQFAGLELDGGAGADTASFEDAAYANFFLNAPVLKNIETKD